MTAERPATGTGATSKQIERAVDELFHTWFGGDPEDERRSYRITRLVVAAACPPTHMIIRRDARDAFAALLEAGDSRGVSDGRWAPEKRWQDAENAVDAARKEMGE